jgi:hypothetical protein
MKIHMTLMVSIVVAAPVFGAPQAELWERWEAHDPDSTISVDHADWGEFLDEYLITDHPTGVNRVEYADVTGSDRAALDAYIERMSDVPVDNLRRDTQFSYWVNVYNALTVQLILEHYPLDSIRDIRRPWDRDIFTVEGIDVTLNDIEHRILRPIWDQDPRIHYVVNCASYGCPDLHAEPLTEDTNEQIMEGAAHEYLSHPRGARFDGDRLVLSSIFDWYTEDFGGDDAGVLEHVAAYAPADVANRIRTYDGRIRYEYDWALNEP